MFLKNPFLGTFGMLIVSRTIFLALDIPFEGDLRSYPSGER